MQRRRLEPYREAQITSAMMIVGSIMIFIMLIVCFVFMQIPSLA